MAITSIVALLLSAAAAATAKPIARSAAAPTSTAATQDTTAPAAVGSNPCTWGPSYWCASAENAERCGLNTTECGRYCANNEAYPELQNGTLCPTLPPPLGSNNCTWGPSYWCASASHAAQCNVSTAECFRYCDANATESLSFNVSGSDICNPPGSNPCTYGPSFWCSSTANALRCNTTVTVDNCAHYCNNTNEYPSLTDSDICNTPNATTPIVGGNSCTWGPSFWCASEANAVACNVTVESCDKYCEDDGMFSLQNSTICHPELL